MDQQKNKILKTLEKNMILFGRVVIPNMFSVESPSFHYEIAEQLMDRGKKQINIIANKSTGNYG